MAKVRSFVSQGTTVNVTANNGTMNIQVIEGPSIRTYTSLETFMKLELKLFQGMFAQLNTSQDKEWLSHSQPALKAMSQTYPSPILLGTLGDADPLAKGAESLDVVDCLTQKKYREWSMTNGTFQSVKTAADDVVKARNDLMATVSQAQNYSAKALSKTTNARRIALKSEEAAIDSLPGKLRTLEEKEKELKKILRELNDAAKHRQWQLAGDQSHQQEGMKSYKRKIKKGKFREFVFFSLHRHSIPYFLAGFADQDPDSKPLNTLTILSKNELAASFDRFVDDQYLPFLNGEGADHPLKFYEQYSPTAGDPRFIADKYYGDQGMHCTPASTPGVAFTLTQGEHSFFIDLLDAARSHDSQLSTKDVNDLCAGLDAANTGTEFGKLAKAYPKIVQFLEYIPARAKHAKDKENLEGKIKGFRQRLNI